MNKVVNAKIGKIMFNFSSYDKAPVNLDVRHCHEEYEILYITEGNGKYVIEGVEYPVRPRTMLFVPPLAYHSLKLNLQAPYERYVLRFGTDDLTAETREFLSAFSTDTEGEGCFFTADALSPSVMSLFERFEVADTLPERERAEFIRILVSEVIILLSVAKRESVPKDEGEFGTRVIKYLNEHIDKDVSLDKLAKRFFVSKYYLCRAFKKHNGISVHGYINQKRVLYAKQLIESGETASGAAYRVGFGDYSAFYRAYVKIIGHSPTAHEGRNDGIQIS